MMFKLIRAVHVRSSQRPHWVELPLPTPFQQKLFSCCAAQNKVRPNPNPPRWVFPFKLHPRNIFTSARWLFPCLYSSELVLAHDAWKTLCEREWPTQHVCSGVIWAFTDLNHTADVHCRLYRDQEMSALTAVWLHSVSMDVCHRQR